MPRYAQVLVDIAHRNIDRVFTYLIPDELVNAVPGTRVKVPFGNSRAVEGCILSVSDQTSLEGNIKPILSLRDGYPAFLPQQIQLAQWIKERYHCLLAQALRLMIPAELRGGRVSEKYISAVKLKASTQQAEKALEGIRYGTKQYSILETLISGDCDKELLTSAFGSVDAPLKELCKKGLAEVYKREVNRSPYSELYTVKTDWLPFVPQQQDAYDVIASAKNGRFLLHGVTGSGKTEVYMRCIKSVLDAGGSAIMLIPEISLTPQTVRRFRERFGEGVAVLHSALSAGERYDEWRRIREGEARVVVGARSAIFAPCSDLRLIIIDEAHEGSYIAGSHPAYDAVEVAGKLCDIWSATLVLGSATPSVEQYYAAENGKYTLVNMTSRINGRPLPEIEVVDMKTELAKGNRSVFSARLYEELRNTIERGNQAILFLNRRGFSTVVTCRACGQTIKCPNCDVSMTYHLSDINSRAGANRLRCHYCGSETPYPSVCPYCGSKYIKFMGAGTEKVEEEFTKLFPDTPVLRMDNDTTRTKDAHLHILEKFSSGKARVLIGTQMIAKGLDFPKVDLVGIVSADTMLQLPDYTGREKTYNLITQVAGRAGRADTDGKVILQTYMPEHYAISDAVSYSFAQFYRSDLRQRQVGWYPPYARIIRAVYFSADGEAAKKECFTRFQVLRQRLVPLPYYSETVLHFNMMTAPIGRIRGQYRYQIILKMVENSHSDELESLMFSEADQQRDAVYVDIEVNPTNFI